MFSLFYERYPVDLTFISLFLLWTTLFSPSSLFFSVGLPQFPNTSRRHHPIDSYNILVPKNDNTNFNKCNEPEFRKRQSGDVECLSDYSYKQSLQFEFLKLLGLKVHIQLFLLGPVSSTGLYIHQYFRLGTYVGLFRTDRRPGPSTLPLDFGYNGSKKSPFLLKSTLMSMASY